MTYRMVYIAEDGTEFFHEDKCKSYEIRCAADPARFKLFDEGMKPLNINKAWSYQTAVYAYFPRREDFVHFGKAAEKAGAFNGKDFPNDDPIPGCYFYDDSLGLWRNFDEIIAKMKEMDTTMRGA